MIWKNLTSNAIINVAIVACVSAQLIKVLLNLIASRKIKFERFIGAGGMPSSHSALTTSVALALARKMGFTSPEFALSVAFAAIVMYDAMGVRRAAGEQARVLNKIIFEFPIFTKRTREDKYIDAPIDDEKTLVKNEESMEVCVPKPLLEKELKEFLGHTPFEVLGGFILGIVVGLFMPIF